MFSFPSPPVRLHWFINDNCPYYYLNNNICCWVLRADAKVSSPSGGVPPQLLPRPFNYRGDILLLKFVRNSLELQQSKITETNIAHNFPFVRRFFRPAGIKKTSRNMKKCFKKYLPNAPSSSGGVSWDGGRSGTEAMAIPVRVLVTLSVVARFSIANEFIQLNEYSSCKTFNL